MSTQQATGGRRIVVAVTGASGAIYAVRFLKACLEAGAHLDLVASAYGHRLLIEECGLNLKADDVPAWRLRSSRCGLGGRA